MYEATKEGADTQKKEFLETYENLKFLTNSNYINLSEKFMENYNNINELMKNQYNNINEKLVEQLNHAKEGTGKNLITAYEKIGSQLDNAKAFSDNYLNNFKGLTQEQLEKYSNLLDERFGPTKQAVSLKLNDGKEYFAQRFEKAQDFTKEESDKILNFALDIVYYLQERMVFHLLTNKDKLVEFVNELNLKDKVSILQSANLLNLIKSGKDKALDLYENGIDYTNNAVEVVAKREKEYLELTREKVNNLLGAANNYLQIKAKEYKNVDSLRDFF